MPRKKLTPYKLTSFITLKREKIRLSQIRIFEISSKQIDESLLHLFILLKSLRKTSALVNRVVFPMQRYSTSLASTYVDV